MVSSLKGPSVRRALGGRIASIAGCGQGVRRKKGSHEGHEETHKGHEGFLARLRRAETSPCELVLPLCSSCRLFLEAGVGPFGDVVEHVLRRVPVLAGRRLALLAGGVV